MNNLDFKKMSSEELSAELNNAELLSQDLHYNHSIAALQNTQELKIARKTIARIKTEIRSRELAASVDMVRDKIIARRKKERK
jgi:large subunit ribosomal protein L29